MGPALLRAAALRKLEAVPSSSLPPISKKTQYVAVVVIVAIVDQGVVVILLKFLKC